MKRINVSDPSQFSMKLLKTLKGWGLTKTTGRNLAGNSNLAPSCSATRDLFAEGNSWNSLNVKGVNLFPRVFDFSINRPPPKVDKRRGFRWR